MLSLVIASTILALVMITAELLALFGRWSVVLSGKRPAGNPEYSGDRPSRLLGVALGRYRAR